MLPIFFPRFGPSSIGKGSRRVVSNGKRETGGKRKEDKTKRNKGEKEGGGRGEKRRKERENERKQPLFRSDGMFTFRAI